MLANLILALAATASAATFRVDVGKGGLTFTPDAVTAAVGDVVEFYFVGGTHDAAVADFATPCAPAAKKEGSFASGVNQGSTTNTKVFKVTVNSTAPTYYYCSVGQHCANGMVAAINPVANQTVATFRAAAKGKAGKTPEGIFGGVY